MLFKGQTCVHSWMLIVLALFGVSMPGYLFSFEIIWYTLLLTGIWIKSFRKERGLKNKGFSTVSQVILRSHRASLMVCWKYSYYVIHSPRVSVCLPLALGKMDKIGVTVTVEVSETDKVNSSWIWNSQSEWTMSVPLNHTGKTSGLHGRTLENSACLRACILEVVRRPPICK